VSPYVAAGNLAASPEGSCLMRGVWRRRSSAGKLSLLGGAAVALVFAAQAQAQTATDLPVRWPGSPAPLPASEAPKPKPAPPPPPPVADGLGENGFYLESDNLIRDDRNNTWTAEGQVEARYQGRVLRADKLVYNAVTGVVTADGHAQIINTDGTTVGGDHLVADDKMRAGFVRGFSAHELHNVTFAADVAVRRSQTVTELNRAIFTPCDICAPNGSPIEPTWSIAASTVVQDHDRHLVFYHNAVLRVKGVPVFYTPVFWHPDPSSPRASGLLVPRIEISSKLGFSYEQPYLQVISPSEELIISPQIDTKVNPFLNLDWSKRFYSGLMDIRVGGTYEQNFDGHGNKFGPATFRSYILANGAFDLSKTWSWGFTAERTSDPLLFDKYDIPNAYEEHGPFAADTERLISQLYATRQDSNSYLSINAISFQGLRQVAVGVTEDNRGFPIVAPLIEARYDVPFDIAGGHLRITASGVALSRDQDLSTTDGPTDNSRRATSEVDWLRTFTLTNGMQLSPYLNLRGDVYNISDLSAADPADHTLSRGQATTGLNFSWPFIRQQGSNTIVLEPIAQLAISPNVKANPNIPDEDSLVFTYDESNLFDANKFPGYDVFDGGQRLNLGGQATFDWGAGHDLTVLLGRTLRAETTNIYPTATGLNNTASDWVVAANTTPIDGLSMFSRALLGDEYGIDRLEIGVDFAYQRFRGYVRYDIDNTIPLQTIDDITYGGKINELEYGGEVFVTKNWGVSVAGIHDLAANDWRLRDFGVIYKDDCIRAEVVYQHQDTIEGQLRGSDAVFLRLSLAILANEGYKNDDSR
jgi:LPS-assembly protein